MLFKPNETQFQYKFLKPKSIHKHNNTYVIHADNDIYIYKDSSLIHTIHNIICMTVTKESLYYVKDSLYYFNTETNEEKAFNFHFKQIICINGFVIGYTKYKCYVINTSNGSFIVKSIIIECLQANHSNIFISSGSTLYIYDYNLEVVNIVEKEFIRFLVNESRIIFFCSENIEFYTTGAKKLRYTTNLPSVNYNYQINDNVLACQDVCFVFLFTLANNKIDQIAKIENISGGYFLQSKLFVFNDTNTLEYNLETFGNKALMINFELLFIAKNLYFGKLKDKIIFYDRDGNYIDTLEFDSDYLKIIVYDSIYISVDELKEDKSMTKMYIISDELTLKTKILLFDKILNIEPAYFIYTENNRYYAYNINNTVKELKGVQDARKILQNGENIETLSNSQIIGDLTEIIDFFICGQYRYYISDNSVKVFREKELIGDIKIDYTDYKIFDNKLVFLTAYELIIISDTVEHIEMLFDTIYISGDFFVGIADRLFHFTIEISKLDVFKEVKGAIEERNVQIAELTENVEHLGMKVDLYHKNTEETKAKIKKWWFF